MRLQEIHLRTSEANAQFMAQNEACSSSRNTLWELISLTAALIFVEGFANAKKCSNEGRALMQLDYRLVNILTKHPNMSKLQSNIIYIQLKHCV